VDLGQIAAMNLRPFDNGLLHDMFRHLDFEPGADRDSEELTRLHRAFVDRVPYENLDIQLGRPTTIDPHESARRIASGRGGYCYHLNGTLAGVLATMGYGVRLARGRIIGHPDSGWGEHMVLLVQSDDLGDLTWVADVGLGDGFRDPMPLTEATIEQAPFRYCWEHRGGALWQFHHDPASSILGFDMDATPVALRAFEAKHAELSTSPKSSFLQKLVAQRRGADHTLTLRGCVFIRADADGVHKHDVDDASEWFALLRNDFGLALEDVDAGVRTQLWERTRLAHLAWLAAGRP
jgi:arylamine N-acetyltransferase